MYSFGQKRLQFILVMFCYPERQVPSVFWAAWSLTGQETIDKLTLGQVLKYEWTVDGQREKLVQSHLEEKQSGRSYWKIYKRKLH